MEEAFLHEDRLVFINCYGGTRRMYNPMLAACGAMRDMFLEQDGAQPNYADILFLY